jgi:adenylate cyclase
MHGTQLASGIGTVLVILVLGPLGALEPLETWWFDRLFELRGSRAPTTPIIIVTIDESSITEMNQQWPFPRARHADLIDRISAGHPLAIGVDLLFDGPSAWGARDDEALGAAIMRAGTVVLSAAKTTDVQMLDGQVAIERTFSRVPLPVIRRGAAAVAHTNIPVESDAHIRRARLARLLFGDQALPAFDTVIHEIAGRAGLRVRPLPTAPETEILINFRGGPRTFPWVPYYRVLRGEVGSEVFSGKIVLIGATSPLLHDLFPTVFAGSGDMPGIEIHANVIETLVRGDPVRATPWWVSTIVAVGLSLLGWAVVVRLRASGLVAIGGLWIPWMAGTLGLALGSISAGMASSS